MARRLANRKRYPKGETGNRSGRPKDIVRFGDPLMKEFYKTVPASLGGKIINKMQGEIIAMQMRRVPQQGPGRDEPPAQIHCRARGRLARRELQANGSVEIDWDEQKEELYQEMMVRVAGKVQVSTQDARRMVRLGTFSMPYFGCDTLASNELAADPRKTKRAREDREEQGRGERLQRGDNKSA
jgi:hypothetical protein